MPRTNPDKRPFGAVIRDVVTEHLDRIIPEINERLTREEEAR